MLTSRIVLCARSEYSAPRLCRSSLTASWLFKKRTFMPNTLTKTMSPRGSVSASFQHQQIW